MNDLGQIIIYKYRQELFVKGWIRGIKWDSVVVFRFCGATSVRWETNDNEGLYNSIGLFLDYDKERIVRRQMLNKPWRSN